MMLIVAQKTIQAFRIILYDNLSLFDRRQKMCHESFYSIYFRKWLF